MILSRSASGLTLRIMIGRSGAVLTLALSLVSAVGLPPPPTPGPVPTPSAHAAPANPRSTAPRSTGPAEVTAERGEASSTYRFPNGSRMVVLSDGPIRNSDNGRWTPINLTLHRDADGEVRPVAAAFTTWLSGGGNTEDAAAVRSPTGLNTALAWDATLPAPKLTGNRALYRNARPGADLLIEVTRTGFVASLIPTGKADSTGLLSPTEIGTPLTLRDSRQGTPAQLVPGLSTIASRAAPAGTLADAPVADRVVAVVARRENPPLSTTVQNTAPNGDLSGDPDLRIGSFDGSTVSRGFLTWDLSKLRGQQVTQATLRLYAEWSPTCRPQGWQVWSTGPIGPATRWANQPAAQRMWATSTTTMGNGAACQAGWTNVDVTPLVKAWLQAGARSGTMMLRASDERNPLSWKRFASGQSSTVPALGVTLAPTGTP
jgi:hypothetical protein